jgi:exopolyphosphatase/guanosine-5'-triphosphate,3'-diphosphate pyrophosphatase
MSEKQAIIDLGSNTTRMLIVEVTDSGAYRLVEESKETIRLAENMFPEGNIKPQAIERAVRAVKIFKSICEYHGIKKIIAAATAAVRESSNQKEVIDTIKKESGIEFKVLSRQEEAYYGYFGVINSIDIKNGIIVDMGGGSMEITGIMDRKPVDSISIPFGALTLTERFLDRDRSDEGQFNALESFFSSKLRYIPWLTGYYGCEMVGVGGTIRSIAKIYQRMTDYPFDDLHNYTMYPEEISLIYNKIRGMKLEDRREMPGLSRDRADIITGGIAGIHTLLKYMKVSRVRVSSHGLRDGMFFKEYLKDQIVEDISRFSVNNLMRLYELDEAHSDRVFSIAKSIFEQLKPVHKIPDANLKLIQAASMLHACGYYYDFQNRFNNTFYNIRNSTLFGFSHIDTYKIGLIAAYYGAGGVKNRYAVIDTLICKEENRSLKKLGVIMALSDSLDRSKRGRVTGIRCNVNKNYIEIEPQYTGDATVELETATNIIPYFKKAFDYELIIKGANGHRPID